MKSFRRIYLGIDCGATTSKVGAIDSSGVILTENLRQRPTLSEKGPEAIVANWLTGVEELLTELDRKWEDVSGVGLAMPGPYDDYGILGKMPNMAASLQGWTFLKDLEEAVKSASGRSLPVVTANDGLLAGLPEAKLIQEHEEGSVLMLVPGSGLGSSYVRADGTLLNGDHQAAVIIGHMPAPYALLGLPAFKCGCGRDWGCFEAYTAISGLNQYLDHFLPHYPDHELNTSELPSKVKALSLRGLAQKGDALALEIFDLQARAMGHAVAAACMALDPTHIVIGGGLMDLESTSETFRSRYLDGIRESASEYAWIPVEKMTWRGAVLGELSQAIGAAMLAADRFST